MWRMAVAKDGSVVIGSDRTKRGTDHSTDRRKGDAPEHNDHKSLLRCHDSRRRTFEVNGTGIPHRHSGSLLSRPNYERHGITICVPPFYECRVDCIAVVQRDSVIGHLRIPEVLNVIFNEVVTQGKSATLQRVFQPLIKGISIMKCCKQCVEQSSATIAFRIGCSGEHERTCIGTDLFEQVDFALASVRIVSRRDFFDECRNRIWTHCEQRGTVLADEVFITGILNEPVHSGQVPCSFVLPRRAEFDADRVDGKRRAAVEEEQQQRENGGRRYTEDETNCSLSIGHE